MTPRPLPRHAVAALFLERQHLDRPRGRRLTARALAAFAEDAGGIQLDSINVVDRAHLLTLWSRFGAFDRARLERLVHRDRVLFEYWAHAACLVSAGDVASWKRAMLDYAAGHTGWRRWLRAHARVLRSVEEEIRARGPLAPAALDARRGRKGSSGWWAWTPTHHALHLLWMRGRVLVHSREHFQKRYDLAERVLPALAAAQPPDAAGFRRWHLERSLHAMGAATERDLAGYLTFPRHPAGERRRTLKALLADGAVVELAVEGERRPWFALARDLPALERAARRRAPSRGTTLLAPFDSLLWHRERAACLFGFDYRVEVYVPGPKRVHGYYVLPVLHDGRLIGRVDARRDRARGVLEVHRVHLEPWMLAGRGGPLAAWGPVDAEGALAGLADALASLARWGETPRVRLGRVEPARWAPALRRALREAGA